MTTALRAFESWLVSQKDLDEKNSVCAYSTNDLIERGLKKLEELKKKHQPKTLVQQFKDRAEFDPLEDNVREYLINVVIPELEK